MGPKHICDATTCFTVVIPALNEEVALPNVLSLLREELPNKRVIVVDNGSGDNTAGVASEMGADVLYEPQRGKGRALIRGLAASQTEVAFCCDADIEGLTSSAICDAVTSVTRGNFPIVRLALGRPPSASPVTALLARPMLAALGHRCHEPLGGMFACNVEWVSKHCLPENWAIDIALTVAAIDEFGYIVEIPVEGITHRVRPIKDYGVMAREIAEFLVNYVERKTLLRGGSL